MKNLALLTLRVVIGGLVAGHGAQKLFGSFQGPGMEGTSGMMESLGLKPGRPWAALAGLSEFGGGSLTALGFLSPLGSLGIIGAMTIATGKVHGVSPIWAQEGGPELPVTNSAVAAAIAMSGPGRYSLDEALGVRLPRWVVVLAFISGVLAAFSGLSAQPDSSGEAGEESA